MPVEIPSVRAEVTENGKKNHVLHSMVFMDRIPTLLCRVRNYSQNCTSLS